MSLRRTQHVITFLRQLTEQGGFWRASDLTFVQLGKPLCAEVAVSFELFVSERICFVGACNPPTDAGRVRLSPRFLRHTPLMFVDFPAIPSLRQIYGTFNRALLKLVPALRCLTHIPFNCSHHSCGPTARTGST